MTRFLSLTMALICALSLASCAGFGPRPAPTPVTPPRREIPATARQACQIPPLPGEISLPSLKLYAAAAAAEIIRCDITRGVAVDVHDGEHADEDAWLGRRVGAN